MKLAYWMYAGPAHIGVLRVSSSFKNVHAIMHAPLGDDYFNVMRSMLERERDFTPVTASIVDRHVLARGSREKVVENITRKNKEETPDLIILTPTCTSSILQEDLQNFVDASIPNNIYDLNHSTQTTPNILKKEPHMEEPIFFEDLADEKTKKSKLPDVILADVNHYRVNELQAADRTLEQIVRYYIQKAKKQNALNLTKTEKPSVNIIGIFTLGFHNQHDCRELKRLFNDLGIKINLIIPEGGQVDQLKNLPQAWFNFVPYREVGLMTAAYLKSEFNMPYVSITPMGLIDTALCIKSILKIIIDLYPKISRRGYLPQYFSKTCNPSAPDLPGKVRKGKEKNGWLLDELQNNIQNNILDDLTMSRLPNKDLEQEDLPFTLPEAFVTSQSNGTFQTLENLFNNYIDQQTRFFSQAAWFSRSIDCQNLKGKKVIVFGDSTHSAKITKILAIEMGIHVCCAGTYCKHDADWFREQVNGFCDQILITDDHTLVGDTITKLEPAAIFGTQMERHVGKRLNIPCGVISAPVHIQNFPLGYRPFLGYEGTNQIADLVYNSFNLGMEDHLLQIFGGHDSVKDGFDSHSFSVLDDSSNPRPTADQSKILIDNSKSLHSAAHTTNGASNGPATYNNRLLATPMLTEASSQKKYLGPSKGKNTPQPTIPEITLSGGQTKVGVNLWSSEGLAELNKVPGFVRGKVKRNTEKYALQNDISLITVEVMYAAKEALSN
uniref:Light-independent protochlorophyllide reductase subunit B n=1 Tax=Volvulina compacta TaxID=51721 RepID=A0A6C0RWS5_9CHLO|nr:protochlorophyllide reductase subunit B [Volvulina compacta]